MKTSFNEFFEFSPSAIAKNVGQIQSYFSSKSWFASEYPNKNGAEGRRRFEVGMFVAKSQLSRR